MGLIVGNQLEDLAESILSEDSNGIVKYKDSGKTELAQLYTDAKNAKIAEYTKVFNYMIQYMEINGIKINLDSAVSGRTVETFITGIGSNSGTLNAPPYPVSGSVKSSKDDKGTQSNDGSGRIA